MFSTLRGLNTLSDASFDHAHDLGLVYQLENFRPVGNLHLYENVHVEGYPFECFHLGSDLN